MWARQRRLAGGDSPIRADSWPPLKGNVSGASFCLVCCVGYENNCEMVMSRQQGNAPWRTQGGAFLLVKKKHCPDRYAYRTRQHYKPTTTKNLLPCDITMPRFFVSRQNPTFHISASQRTRPRAMDGQGHCKDTGSRTGTSAGGIDGQLPSARDLPCVRTPPLVDGDAENSRLGACQTPEKRTINFRTFSCPG